MAEPPPMIPPVGDLLGQILDGRYRIVRQIAAGGMSTVFEAIHVKIGRTVAIKILHPAMASDPELVARFLKEARAVGTFGHPNIVASTDFGELPGHVPYLVLEYLEGRTLGHEIKTGGPLTIPRALHIASQIASALDAAHARGVVHRDLTAENVFLTRVGADPDHVKVLDFGISKFLAPPPRDAAEQMGVGAGADTDAAALLDVEPALTTRRGMTMGTPEFMAPEQISDPSSVDARVDIYALGVILHYMLAGQTPFGTPFGRLPAHVLLTRVLIAPIPAIERSDVPGGVRALIAKALAKDREGRFSSMREMEGAIAGFIVAGDGPPYAPGEAARKPLRWAGYAVAALVAVLSAAALLRARMPGPTPTAPGPNPRPVASAGPPSPAVERAPAPAPESPPPAVAADVNVDVDVDVGREAIAHRKASPETSEGPRATAPQRRAAVRRGGAAKGVAAAPEVPAPLADATAAPRAARDQPAGTTGTSDRPAGDLPAVAPRASDKPGRPAPAGAVDPVLTQALVRSHLSEIERCYDRGKMDDPELKGKVTVRIHLAPSGAVTSDEIESSSLNNSGVESCIVDAVRGWRFPAPSGGRAAVISYPFNLR